MPLAAEGEPELRRLGLARPAGVLAEDHDVLEVHGWIFFHVDGVLCILLALVRSDGSRGGNQCEVGNFRLLFSSTLLQGALLVLSLLHAEFCFVFLLRVRPRQRLKVFLEASISLATFGRSHFVPASFSWMKTEACD